MTEEETVPTPEPVEPATEQVQQDPQAARIAELEAALAAAKDERLRALAEAANVQRRAQKDREEALKYGPAALARDMLSVHDNLVRAIAAVPADVRAANPAFESLAAGVEMVERELTAAFAKHKILKIDPAGEKFDPNHHQAMFEVEHTGQPAGTVVQVLQPGYVLHDRLLRAAMVGVAKGSAEPPPKVDTVA